MDCPLPVVSDDGDLPWSDNRSMDSDDDESMDFDDQHRGWMDVFSDCSATAAPASLSSNATVIASGPVHVSGSASTASISTSHMSHAGQLSPISTGMDVPMSGGGSPSSCPPSATTAPAMVHSASTSSCADSWSLGFGDSDDQGAGDVCNDVHWERQGSEEILAVPKLEPQDDDEFCMDAFKETPMTPVPSNTVPNPVLENTKVKRPRGRPRKNPAPPALNPSKVTKGRSKTGCLTCRKRKKKCDEAKPRCMNCEKNSVVCEGYPEKQLWRSPKDKNEEEARTQALGLPIITLQPIFDGLETDEDRIFWKHYNDHLSNVLTVEGEHKNAFTELLIPIAIKHRGLMHSILSLAGTHLDYETPYGVNLLKKHDKTSMRALEERSNYHHDEAMQALFDGFHPGSGNKEDPAGGVALSARYGQMLCLLLETLAQGKRNGEHRLHLSAYQNLIRSSPPQDTQFLTFITEFFQYHIFADELIRYPYERQGIRTTAASSPANIKRQDDTDDDQNPILPPARLADENWTPPPGVSLPIQPARLLGVADGLFNHMCAITTIRNRIRDNMATQADPLVDYTSLYQAAEIDEAIREWTPRWPPGDSRGRVGLLYKQMMWVYLYRTIYPPSPSPSGYIPGEGDGSSSTTLSSSPSSTSLAGSSASSSAATATTMTTATTSTAANILGGADAGFPIVHTPPQSAVTSCSSSPQLRPNSAGAGAATTSALNTSFDLPPHQLPLDTNPRRHSIAHPSGNPFISSSTTLTPRKAATFYLASSSSSSSHHHHHVVQEPHHQQQQPQYHNAHSQQQVQRAESPPPIRHPPHQDARITLAVEESLAILDGFKPSDPAQTLLLIPCLVIGAACFSPGQQARVRAAVRSVRGYTGLRNADCVAEVLEEVWRLMAQGDWPAVWDWQRVAAENLGLDFLCA